MDVLMPQLGETVAEGKITKWFKAAGDDVKPGDNLFEIETDKVSMEVPSTTTGELAEIRVAAGEVAPVGAIVAVIADGSGVASKATPPRRRPSPRRLLRSPAPPTPLAQRMAAMAPHASLVTPPSAAKATGPLDPFFEVRTPERNYGPARLPGGAVVTPLARRLAAERGIDLSRLKRQRRPRPHRRAGCRAGARARRARRITAVAGPSAAEVMALYRDVPFEEVPLDAMRRTIATRLVQAKQTIPHFYLTADVDIGALSKLREEANAAAPKGTRR